jgi:hypothetical protein
MGAGRIIGAPNTPSVSAAPGVWSLREQANSKRDAVWYSKWLSAENAFKTVSRNPLDIHAWCSSASLTACTISRDTSVIDSPYGGVPLKMSVTGNDPHIGTYASSTWNLADCADGQTWEVKVLAKTSVSSSIQLFIFGAASDGTWSPVTGNFAAGTRNTSTVWGEYAFQYTFTVAVSKLQIRLDGPDSGGTGQDIWFDGLQVYRIS